MSNIDTSMASEDELRARIASLEREVHVLHAMLRSTPDLISRTTVDGKFLYLNHVTPGFRMEDVVGTTLEEQRIRLQVALDAGAVGMWTHAANPRASGISHPACTRAELRRLEESDQCGAVLF